MVVVQLPSPAKEQEKDLILLEKQLGQLAFLSTYSQTELFQRGIPQEITEASFPLCSFTRETAYFGDSIIGQATNSYPSLGACLHGTIPFSNLSKTNPFLRSAYASLFSCSSS